MATDVDRQAIINGYAESLAGIEAAAALGRSLASGIDRVYFVSCGGPNRLMLTLEYWIQHFSPSLEVRRYFPAEFVTQNPPRIDGRTLVMLGSKSGTTPETVEAANFVAGKPCTTVAFTTSADLPLAKSVQHVLLTGEAPGATAAQFMLGMAFIGGLLAAKDGWPQFHKLMSSLRALPEAMADAAVQGDRQAKEDARLLKDDRILYHVAAGPVFSTAYCIGVCVLMEMQWMHSVALEAAEFFHGPFEIVDQNTPLVLMKGEDPSRPLMDRVERFCKKYTERLFIYDSVDYEMKGIDPEIRQIVAPYILQGALRRVAERLAVWHNQPLSTRRYMWKTEY